MRNEHEKVVNPYSSRSCLRAFRGDSAVKRDAGLVLDSVTAKYIQRGADGEVDSIFPKTGDFLEILERFCAAGVGCGNLGPERELPDKFVVNSPAEAFHIDGMDEKLGAVLTHFAEGFGAQTEVREFLPAIGHDEIV